jgi:hypothetical protein
VRHHRTHGSCCAANGAEALLAQTRRGDEVAEAAFFGACAARGLRVARVACVAVDAHGGVYALDDAAPAPPDAAAHEVSLYSLTLEQPEPPLTALPADVLALGLLPRLPPADACAVGLTCDALRRVALGDDAWAAWLRRHAPDAAAAGGDADAACGDTQPTPARRGGAREKAGAEGVQDEEFLPDRVGARDPLPGAHLARRADGE